MRRRWPGEGEAEHRMTHGGHRDGASAAPAGISVCPECPVSGETER